MSESNNINNKLVPTNGSNSIGQDEDIISYEPILGEEAALTIDFEEFSEIKRSLSIAIQEAVKESGSGNKVTITLRMELSSPNDADADNKEINPIKSKTTIKSNKTIDQYDDETNSLFLIKDSAGYIPNRRQVSIYDMKPVEEEVAQDE